MSQLSASNFINLETYFSHNRSIERRELALTSNCGSKIRLGP